jgi:hypothetical protein
MCLSTLRLQKIVNQSDMSIIEHVQTCGIQMRAASHRSKVGKATLSSQRLNLHKIIWRKGIE